MSGIGSDVRTTANPNEVRINCPFCPGKGKGEDSKYHLYVNTTKGRFICFRCDERGTLNRLRNIARFALPTASSPAFDKLREKINSIGHIETPTEFDLDLISKPISPEVTPIAWNYMKVRGFTPEECDKYGLRVGQAYEDPKEEKLVLRWKGRVIFPFYDKGEVVFLVGRSYTDREPKYINSMGDKAQVVYGIDRIQGDKCMLCEGIISAIAAERSSGMCAVSVLGKTATDFQLSKLRSKCKKIWVCLDGDVSRRERDKLNLQLLTFGFNVYEILLPDETDPDDLKDDFPKYLHSARKVY